MNCARKEPLTLEFWTLSTVWAGFRDASGSVSKAYLFVIEEFLEGDARIRGYASEALDSEASVNGTQHCFHEMSLAMHTIWPKVSRTAEEFLFSVFCNVTRLPRSADTVKNQEERDVLEMFC